MGQLTTHVLDTSAGLPASGVRIEVHELTAPTPALIARGVHRRGWAVRGPAGRRRGVRAGRYSLTFFVADYFRSRGLALPAPAFIEDAVIRIGVAHPNEHYHVPLLVSPWSYSVYRGG